MQSDGTLTAATEIRRGLSAPAALALVLVPVLVLFAGGATAADWQPVESIRETAARYAASQLGADGDDVRVEAGELDTRLRMNRCDVPLSGFLPNGMGNGNRLVVGVRCEGTKPWKLFVPVRIARYADVLVVSRSLPRGHVLTTGDVHTERRDLSSHLKTYAGSLRQLPGRRLKRPVLAGTPLTHNMVDAEQIVRRGQKVTLVVDNGGMQIRMAGRALSDGALDQRIRVENVSSRRVVEGVVRSPEVVEIRMN
ncbi:flagellar basal body P-ring formation chaperone FlgA [Lentisalinibacter salinarum]|uniref:flagellar basal body P-ring formation chaperone FlgA n=1 Tax=Lentisalinibacter salinarum TaxID=2992239 RepID=UPI00386EBDE0